MSALFGLIVLLGAVSMAILGTVLIGGGRRSRRRGRVVTGTVLLLVTLPYLGFAGWRIADEWAVDLNPGIGSNDEIRGDWTDGTSTLTLGSGNDATLIASSGTLRGEWSREDWNLFLHGPGLPSKMRFYRKANELRLLPITSSDPDHWNTSAGWRRK